MGTLSISPTCKWIRETLSASTRQSGQSFFIFVLNTNTCGDPPTQRPHIAYHCGRTCTISNRRPLELTYPVQLTVHGPQLMVPGSRQPLAPLFDLRKQKTSDTSCQVTYSALWQDAWPNTLGGRNDDSTQCQRGSSTGKAWWSRSHHSDREVGTPMFFSSFIYKNKVLTVRNISWPSLSAGSKNSNQTRLDGIKNAHI